jgi:hypothetical protein
MTGLLLDAAAKFLGTNLPAASLRLQRLVRKNARAPVVEGAHTFLPITYALAPVMPMALIRRF